MTSFFLKLIAATSRIGAHPDDSPEIRLQKAIQVNAVVLGGLPFQLGLGLFFFMLGVRLSAGSVLFFAVVSLVSLGWFAITRRYFGFFKFIQLLIAVLSPSVGSVFLGGFLQSGMVQMWGIVTPLLALVLYPPRLALYWLALFLASLLVANGLSAYLPPLDYISPAVATGLALINVFFITGMMFAALYFFVSQRELAYQLLRGEQEKSENLLLNILPKEIAAILKNENRVIADHFEGASILFADVVNFTPLSASMTPVALVELLNEIFSHFDGLVEKYGLEKIKTIGDCYMVASGVPRPRADHAQALTRMALEMQVFVGGARISRP